MADMNKDLNVLKTWFTKSLNKISRKRTTPIFKGIKISEEIESYLSLASRFEAAVKEVIVVGVNDLSVASVATRYKLDFETLRQEIQRFQVSGAELYEYIELGRIFTYKEALILLEILVKIPCPFCACQICTLERIPYLAYNMARQKGKSYPPEWNRHQRADLAWETYFKVKYSYEILNSFSTECSIPRKSNQNA